MKTTSTKRILELASTRGAICANDLREIQAAADLLRSMARRGLLLRMARGIYMLPDYPVSEHHSLVEVVVRHPQAVICLLSALQFHELGRQLPHQVWVAIPKASKQPTSAIPLRVHRFSGKSMTFGIETYLLEGVAVRITSRAKTVADCLKFRNKIGIDTAIESLRDFIQNRRPGDLQKLHAAAKVCREEKILNSYLEVML